MAVMIIDNVCQHSFIKLSDAGPATFFYKHLSLMRENWSSGFPTRSYTNRAAQSLNMARVREISDLGRRGIELSK